MITRSILHDHKHKIIKFANELLIGVIKIWYRDHYDSRTILLLLSCDFLYIYFKINLTPIKKNQVHNHHPHSNLTNNKKKTSNWKPFPLRHWGESAASHMGEIKEMPWPPYSFPSIRYLFDIWLLKSTTNTFFCRHRIQITNLHYTYRVKEN